MPFFCHEDIVSPSGLCLRALTLVVANRKRLKKELDGAEDNLKAKEMRKFLEAEVGNGEEQVGMLSYPNAIGGLCTPSFTRCRKRVTPPYGVHKSLIPCSVSLDH